MITDYFDHIQFAHPWMFLLLGLLPLMVIYYMTKGRKSLSALPLSSLGAPGLQNWKSTLIQLPFLLRLLTVLALILALAKPQTISKQEQAEGEGIDIVLCIDVSGSMTAQDFTPNRLEAAKKVAIDFVNSRLTDRIAVVIFSGESFTQCPLTTDRSVLVSAISNIHNGLLEDGTAIGSGLSTSVDRLRTGKAASKVVLLLTDGVNNGGLIDPKTAKEIARTFGVKVYTIGVGSEGYAPKPINTAAGVVMEREKVSIDEKLLTEIAVETGGRYFRAKDNEGLSDIYRQIDGLEKSQVTIVRSVRYQDKFFPFAAAALFFLLLEIIFRYTLFRKFP